MGESIESLESKRRVLLEQVSEIGDMRRGSITETYRACGKKGCCCNEADHQGHGPYFAYTRKVEGKTKSLQLRVGPRLLKIEREVEAYRRFRHLSEELLAVNEAICEARPIEESQDSEAKALKKTLRKKSKKRSPRK